MGDKSNIEIKDGLEIWRNINLEDQVILKCRNLKISPVLDANQYLSVLVA